MIGPAGTIENGRTRLQKGKIVFVGNENAKTEQFKRGFPGMLARRWTARRQSNNVGPEAAAVLPAFCARRGCRSSSGSIAGLALTYQSPNLWRDEVGRKRYPDNGLPIGTMCEITALRLSPSVITGIGRTIERRLIRTLHLVERSILRFRISPTCEGKEYPPAAAISSCRHCALPQWRPGLQARPTAATANALATLRYRDAPYLRSWKSC